jgi:4-diphosphocytidyl-2-C-methyl-D-erythritol kinase
MRAARVAAQAKINLWLHVGPLDATGYHAVVTLFQRIDLADDVVVRTGSPGRNIDVSGPALPSDGLGDAERNLAFRAAALFADTVGWPSGYSIELTKNIPVGGGLGGGSADAGAVLRALNALSPRPISASRLGELARQLGADVPFLASDLVTAAGSGSRAMSSSPWSRCPRARSC